MRSLAGLGWRTLKNGVVGFSTFPEEWELALLLELTFLADCCGGGLGSGLVVLFLTGRCSTLIPDTPSSITFTVGISFPRGCLGVGTFSMVLMSFLSITVGWQTTRLPWDCSFSFPEVGLALVASLHGVDVLGDILILIL